MEFFADLPALCVSRALRPPSLLSTPKKLKILKLVKRAVILLSVGSEAGVYV